MNKTRQRTRLFAMILGLLFIITTVFAVSFISVPKVSAAVTDPLIKFKQVEAGEDFVIALSYDNQLFAWSLKDKSAGNTYTNTTMCLDYDTLTDDKKKVLTLGDYYPSTPILVNVDFRTISCTGAINTESGTNTISKIGVASGANTYDITNEAIKKLAVTKTTAAFITEKNLIYTWGLDLADEPYLSGDTQKNLLMRTTVDGRYDTAGKHIMVPHLIKYIEGGAFNQLLPFKNNLGIELYAKQLLDISGGENNYVIKFISSENANTTKNVIWGESIYSQKVSTVGYYGFGKAANDTASIIGGGDDLYIGGSTVGKLPGVGGTLSIKGKNYYVANSSMPLSGTTFEPSKISTTATSGIGDVWINGGTKEAPVWYKSTVAVLPSFSQLNSTALKARGTDTVGFYGSNGKGKSSQLVYPVVSMSSGFGYGITTSGVSFYGNDTNGQSGGGTTFTGNALMVAAGKVKSGKPMISGSSGTDKPAPEIKTDGEVPVAASVTVSEMTLKSDFVDGNNFISGILDSSNNVHVWGNIGSAKIARTDITSILKTKYGFNENNKIVYLSAGYGNNMFALSSLGKIYRIYMTGNTFDVELYNDFSTAAGVSIPNAQYSESLGNVTFKTGYYKTDAKAEISLANFNAKGTAAEQKFSVIDSFAAPIVSSKSGDAFRMMLPSTQITSSGISTSVRNSDLSPDSTKTLSNVDSGIKGRVSGNVADYASALKFSWKTGGQEIPLNVAQKYFDIAFIYTLPTAENACDDYLSFQITPKQSTMDDAIIVKFSVGRYDSKLNDSNLTNSTAVSDMAFYDFGNCSFSVKVENTKAVASNTNKTADGKSIIPLLDANNPFNNTYSLAAMDVSKGFEQLATALNSKFTLSTKDNIIKDIKEQLTGGTISHPTAADSGFPATSKIASGKLDYYGVQSFYTDKYNYLTSDHDGDVISFVGKASPTKDGWNNYFDAASTSVTFKIDLSSLTAEQLAEAKLMFTNLPETSGNNNKMHFNNQFGFTTEIGTDNILKVTYQVFRITAKASMPDFAYAENDIKKPITSFDNVNTVFGISHELKEHKDSAETLIPTSMPVFTQSSLSLKAGGKHEFYGSTDKTVNNYVYPAIEMTLGDPSTAKTTFNVADFFSDSSNIRFAYQGKFMPSDYTAFVGTFNSDMIEMSLDSTLLSFTPKTSGNHGFTLEIKRVCGTNTLIEETKETESMTIHFNIDVKPRTDFNLKLSQEEPSYKINSQKTIGLDTLIDCEAATMKKFVKLQVDSTDTSVVTAAVSEDNQSIILEPGSSGTAIINFTATLFNKKISGTVAITVATLSTMPSTVSIIDKENISVSKLKEFLIRQNASSIADGVSLALDYDKNATDSVPFYFETTTDYSEAADAKKEWKASTIEDTLFIKNVVLTDDKLEDNKFIRVSILSLNSTIKPPIVRIVVKFKDSDTNRYEVAFKVSPAEKTLMDNNQILEIELVKDTGKANIKSRENPEISEIKTTPREGKSYFDINISFITDIIAPEGSKTYTFVSAIAGDGDVSSEAYLDVQCEKINLYIYPKYPTFSNPDGDRCPVQVSIKSGEEVQVLTFYVRVSGIETTLDKDVYQVLIISVFFSVLGLLIIIFFIRMGIYWKKRAEQRRIIRKNQILIKMRDKMHNKTETVSKEQIVKTKLKIEDPKYAKMFNDMRKDKEAQTGITLDSSLVAHKAENKVKAKNAGKNKKGGKKSIEELKAELEAKRAAFTQMQSGSMSEMNQPISQPIVDSGVSRDSTGRMFDSGNDYSDLLTSEDVDNQIKAKLGADDILLDVENLDNRNDN